MTDLVAADIGGTHARFALAKIGADGAIALGEVETLRTSEHPSLDAAWETYRARMDRPLPPAAALAFAGPVASDEIQLTNNSWHVRLSGLEERLGVSRLTVVNDFEAVGHAVARADQEHFLHLAGPDHPLPSHGMVSILGPGTGLGLGLVIPRTGGVSVVATEGGHAGFAPRTDEEIAVGRFIADEYGFVSWERLLSGRGLVNIHRALCQISGETWPGHRPEDITAEALENASSMSRRVVELFCAVLGAYAGDVAVIAGARGGIYLGGGILPRIRELVPQTAFEARFQRRGPMTHYVANIPVNLILSDKAALLGAAALAEAGGL